jgi:Carboxypeptidase regulatory-like domain/TonB dependent receptor
VIRSPSSRGAFLPIAFLLVASIISPANAQTETGTVYGSVADPTGAVVPNAVIRLIDVDRGTQSEVATRSTGFYTVASVPPGHYRLEVEKSGFKSVRLTGITVNVQDNLEQNFKLDVGSSSEVITVVGNAVNVNTTDGTVSTVVDRQFAENLPLNGRSFQSLIELTPGVVVTTSNFLDNGQFSVNGQRADANYFMVDGVSANVGLGLNSTYGGQGVAGALPAFSVTGGTNSLVSVDAMQEFRIQTSTYAPEFGRMPGGQISIVTRSGTNEFHGTAFDYFRNDVLDANNWFNGYTNNPPLPKAEERQDDFGGTLGGPIIKDRTFFFFSYEGLRLRLPQTMLTTVPDITARANAAPSVQPFLNAYPRPNGPDNATTGIAQFNGSYSDPASLNAYSIRVDHRINQGLTLFGRYNDSPSSISQRAAAFNGTGALSTIADSDIYIRTATLGSTWAPKPNLVSDLRFNYSHTGTTGSVHEDDFGGAVPYLPSLPSPFTTNNASFVGYIAGLQQRAIFSGLGTDSHQQQINVIGSVSLQLHSHSLKFGADYRRLSPNFNRGLYFQGVAFGSVSSAENGSVQFSAVESKRIPDYLFRNLCLYAQDTWRLFPRLTLTYGLRWDVDFAPASTNGLNFPGLTGFNPYNLSTLALAPGAPPYQTRYRNFAPRIGVAYQLSDNRDFQTVFRAGFGIFYDLASSEAGNSTGYYPIQGVSFNFSGTFPLGAAAAAPPAIVPPTATNGVPLWGFDPNLKLPDTLEWNASLEQGLGKQQTFSLSYVGAGGRRLLAREFSNNVEGNPNATIVYLILNGGTSDYDALQVQFQRRLSRGLQALASYTWAHSIDTGSAASYANQSNVFAPATVAGSNRGPSDFDIRHAFSAAVTYDIPSAHVNPILDQVVRSWSVENIVQARSAVPVDVLDGNYEFVELGGFNAPIRPDLIPGTSLYLYGSQYPGRKALNPAAFADPPTNPTTGQPLRNGDLPRNFLRGFDAVQWDLAIHRSFPIYERVGLQFRAEMFNVLNHPNFGPPANTFGASGFGISNQILAESLNGNNLGGGALSPLYQIGGPRSIQLALKLQF